MEPLAFVEVLGRHHEVLARHPVTRWPARVGRSYDGEVILDDPFVAPRHVQIEPAIDGHFKVSDLQSLNGLWALPAENRIAEAQVGPEDVLRIGQTQIRIRSASYAAHPEAPLRAAGVHRRALGFAVAATVLLALVLWSAWVVTASQEEKIVLVYPALGVFVGVGVWIAVWALVGRAAGGRDHFAAHGFIACAALSAMLIADTLFGYLSFGLDRSWLEYVDIAVVAAVFAYMVYRHLRLNSRSSPRKLGIISVVASLAVSAAFAGLQLASDSPGEGRMRYDQTIRAPEFLWVDGSVPTVFLAQGEKLKRKVDALARTER